MQLLPVQGQEGARPAPHVLLYGPHHDLLQKCGDVGDSGKEYTGSATDSAFQRPLVGDMRAPTPAAEKGFTDTMKLRGRPTSFTHPLFRIPTIQAHRTVYRNMVHMWPT